MAVTRVAMRVIVAALGNDFIYAHKFKKDSNGPDYLKSCRSNKKSFQFTQLANKSLLVEFVKVYFLDRVGQDGNVTGTLDDIATSVISYINEKTSDAMFKNLVCASKIVSAASLFRKAC